MCSLPVNNHNHNYCIIEFFFMVARVYLTTPSFASLYHAASNRQLAPFIHGNGVITITVKDKLFSSFCLNNVNWEVVPQLSIVLAKHKQLFWLLLWMLTCSDCLLQISSPIFATLIQISPKCFVYIGAGICLYNMYNTCTNIV